MAKATKTTSTTSLSRNHNSEAENEEINFEDLVRGFETKRKAAEVRQLAWRQVLSGQPPKTPLCHCQQPTVLRTVLKTNDNWGRKFYVCTKPAVRTNKFY